MIKLNMDSANFEEAAEMLWVILANVSEGDWTKQSVEWRSYACAWRDYYFAAIRNRENSIIQYNTIEEDNNPKEEGNEEDKG